MQTLTQLKRRLKKLRSTRRQYRLMTALSDLLTVVLCLLLVTFFIDLGFLLNVSFRMVLLLLSGSVLLWALCQIYRAKLNRSESLLSMAVLVEHDQQISSDLVAALQFSDAQRTDIESPQLKQAVIQYVDRYSQRLEIPERLLEKPHARRFVLLATTSAVLLAGLIFFPDHLAAYWNRMLLGSEHYPSKTIIEKITINQLAVDVIDPAASSIKCISGTPVEFAVICSGELPTAGTARLKSSTGDEITVELKKLEYQQRRLRLHDAKATLVKVKELLALSPSPSIDKQIVSHLQQAADSAKYDAPKVSKTLALANRHSIDIQQAQRQLETAFASFRKQNRLHSLYVGKLSRLYNPCSYQLFFGDAWTEVAKIGITQYAAVQYRVIVRPPEYTQLPIVVYDGQNIAKTPTALIGSDLRFELKCENKSLQQAWVMIEGQKYALSKRIEKNSDGKSHTVWTVGTENSELTTISQTTRFQFYAIDEDQLNLEYPLSGKIQVREDQPPRITASMVTQWIRPKYSRPSVVVSVFDDYALGKIVIHAKVFRKKQLIQQKNFTAAEFSPALLRDQLPLMRQKYVIDMSLLEIKPGDQVKISLEATDFRGKIPGKSTLSKEILLKVTDENGILSSLTPSLQQAEKQLHETFLIELGIKYREKK